jgi:hypothetical protein
VLHECCNHSNLASFLRTNSFEHPSSSMPYAAQFIITWTVFG